MFGEIARILLLRDSLRMVSKSSNKLWGRKDNLLLLRSRLSRLLSKPLKAPGFKFPIRQLWKSSSLMPVSKNPWSWTVWMGLFCRLVELIHLKFWKEFFVITLIAFSFKINLSSFNFIFVKLSSMFSILLLDKSSVFSDFMLEMAIKGIFPRRLLARSSCDSTGTPFWKAIEWIFMMLLRLRSSLNNCFRFQNTPSLQLLTSGNNQQHNINNEIRIQGGRGGIKRTAWLIHYQPTNPSCTSVTLIWCDVELLAEVHEKVNCIQTLIGTVSLVTLWHL